MTSVLRLLLLLLLSLSLLHHSLSATANNYIHKKTHFRPELISDLSTKTHPTTFFEVTKPIQLPKTKPCSYLLLQHDFGYTYGSPPVLANYTPPSNCPSQNFAKIVLQWEATCKGTQFDRIFGVWLGGVELLRSCTAEPTASGIVWTVKKDITRYYSLLMNNQTLAVFLGNLVNDVYTGVYHAKITIHFYPAEVNSGNSVSGYGSSADLIIPISQNIPSNDGLWFRIGNSADTTSKKFMIPQNAYRAVVEVYVSFHENDEFWYTNLPNNFITANNLSMPLQNGAFREVVVALDGMEIGAVWPFTVIYTGGFNPLLWRPITGIGSFDLPSYDIEVTPFLGTILDGKTHEFAFRVTNALNVWLIDANLHVWLDKESVKTEGQLLKHSVLPAVVSLVSNFTGINGNFLTTVNKSVSSVGWVKSSHGKIATNAIQLFDFSNFMVLGKDGDLQIVNQIINFNDSVDAKSSSSFFSTKSSKRFPLYLYLEDVDNGNGTFSMVTNLTLGYNEQGVKDGGSGFSVSSLKNLQNGQSVLLRKGKSIVAGSWSTQQAYQYGDGKFCYFRNVSSSNSAILHDEEGKTCRK
ncbi:peptide-N4-(N-acetyl-beta-glucosaminyl)asparagine amidase A-like [Rhododendron vialii]|uniref:peptide-N4-(N-acetyl-beta- glucosaminyl)asparagine amidase A-like n=1 Tax=Rhododendron vialii TaxID=182163 RepID=UPI00266030C0|nr:peptide-N4-(N-acetyl-beta-glucosaminyl)asparagine amidase A-like [Rhododendron vialii]